MDERAAALPDGGGHQALWRRRALEQAELTVTAGRIHAILGENGAGKSTLIKIMSGVVAPDEGRMMLEGREVRFADPAAANRPASSASSRSCRSIPDLTVADNIAIARSAQALRPDRPGAPSAAWPRRRSPAPARADIHPLRAGQGPAAVAPADGRDRQGAGAQSAHAHPRRGDLGADRGRRDQGLRGAQAAARRRAGAPLHLAPHARDRRARRRVHGVPQRPATSPPTRPAPRPTTRSSR